MDTLAQRTRHLLAPPRGRWVTFIAFIAIGAAVWTSFDALSPDPPAPVPAYFAPVVLSGLYVLAFLAGLVMTEKRNAVLAFAGHPIGSFAAQAYGLADSSSDSLYPFCFAIAYGLPIVPAFLAGYGFAQLLRSGRQDT